MNDASANQICHKKRLQACQTSDTNNHKLMRSLVSDVVENFAIIYDQTNSYLYLQGMMIMGSGVPVQGWLEEFCVTFVKIRSNILDLVYWKLHLWTKGGNLKQQNSYGCTYMKKWSRQWSNLHGRHDMEHDWKNSSLADANLLLQLFVLNSDKANLSGEILKIPISIHRQLTLSTALRIKFR